MSILFLLLIASIGYAMPSVKVNPVKVNVSELARGTPTEIVAILPLAIAPSEIYLSRDVQVVIVPLVIATCDVYKTRNGRDVDVGYIAILNNEEVTIHPKGIRKYRDVDKKCQSISYKSKISVSASAILARGNLGNRSSKNV